MQDETTPVAPNLTMGRVIARVWSDATFKIRLIAEPKDALAELAIALPKAASVVARENTEDLVHLVTCAPPAAMPPSALSDIRDFGETYRDPRLWSLNWLGRDPVATRRMVDNPIAELAKIGVHPPKGLSIVLLVNTPTSLHMTLPPRPADSYCTPRLFERLAAGHAPAALRLGRLFGAGLYDTLLAALSGVVKIQGGARA